MAIKAGRRYRDSHLCNHLNDHRRTIPGKHLATENIRGQLVARGIQPNSARKAAMFQLAGEIPTPILAEMLGLSTQTATRWAALVARDWSQHTAARHQDAAERGRTTYVLNEMDPKTCLPRYRR